MVDTLDSCFDDDINNDMNSLYVEIIDKNRTRMHDLWPKVETHFSYVHGEGEKQHKPITLGSIRDA